MKIPHQSGGWGGARPGSGRRASGPIASEPHRVRPPVSPHHAVHVTARVVAAARARRGAAYRALRRALVVSLARPDFRVISLAVRARRIELVVEADDRIALARGMQGFQVAAARHWNRDLGRRGQVFRDRYRARALRTAHELRAVVTATWTRTGWPASALLQSPRVLGVLGSLDSTPPPLASGSSGMRYSSSSHLP
ncbi:MAG TPA: hypothetical protein VGF94_02215, partial [Kofleriaceae bacterium]